MQTINNTQFFNAKHFIRELTGITCSRDFLVFATTLVSELYMLNLYTHISILLVNI